MHCLAKISASIDFQFNLTVWWKEGTRISRRWYMYHSGVVWVFFSKQYLFTPLQGKDQIQRSRVFVTCITSLDTVLPIRDLQKGK